jgi:hypothetical protein
LSGDHVGRQCPGRSDSFKVLSDGRNHSFGPALALGRIRPFTALEGLRPPSPARPEAGLFLLGDAPLSSAHATAASEPNSLDASHCLTNRRLGLRHRARRVPDRTKGARNVTYKSSASPRGPEARRLVSGGRGVAVFGANHKNQQAADYVLVAVISRQTPALDKSWVVHHFAKRSPLGVPGHLKPPSLN